MPSQHSYDGKRQNGCYTDGSPCDGFFGTIYGGGRNSNGHCDTRDPGSAGQASVIDVQIYPPIDAANGLFHQPADRVMYDSVTVQPYPAPYQGGVDYASPSSSTQDASGQCGRIVKSLCGDAANIFDFFPTGLSFQPMDSDTWFGYLYDIGTNIGIVGTPCYHVTTETETRAAPTGLAPDPNSPGPVSSKAVCTECAGFTCTPLRTTISYTYNGPNETNDPDCPYPLVFAIGTPSNKVVISYDQLSTLVPDGVTDIDFNGSGGTTPAWRKGSGSQEPTVTSQNPWQAGEESFTTFEVFEGPQFASTTAIGLSVKARISPALDTTTDPATIVGTKWEFMELISPGQGYTAGDTYTLSYVHTHLSGDTSTFNIDISIQGTGPISQQGGSATFDTLLPGDTLNGHMVLRAFHTDLENFSYQIIYLDQNGADFVKDTQYTSSRNHVVTAHAGFGILDRAFYGGYFEFFDKSIQYTTHNVDLSGADVWNTVRQPEVELTLSNGRVSSATIIDGGQGWDTVKDPYLQITDPNNPSGKAALAKGTFSGGVLTAIEITRRGSGYDMSTRLETPFIEGQEYGSAEEFEAAGDQVLVNPPKVWVRGYDPEETFREFDGIPEEEDDYKTLTKGWQDAGAFPEFFENRAGNPLTQEELQAFYDLSPRDRRKEGASPFQPGNLAQSLGIREDGTRATDKTIPVPNTEVQADTSIDRSIDLPQRLYSRSAVETARDRTTPLDRPFPDRLNNDIDPGAYERWKKGQKDAFDQHNKTRDIQYDNLIQDVVPDDIKYKERRVETTQRRFLDLPKSSAGTKYYMKQYRSDPRKDVYFTISLTCTPVEDGCAHINCLGPPKPADFTVATANVDYQYTYLGGATLGPQGPGCKQWNAVGQQQIRHHMTKSTNTFVAANGAYGNPFDI
jgi:hypothetical protein